MRPITPKKPNKLSPIWLRHAIVTRLLNFQNTLYEQQGPCPRCGSITARKNHIYRKKIFCRVIEEDGSIMPVYVHIRYFTCKDCGKVFRALDIPFVPGVAYASCILDLALYHADLTHHQVEHKLADLGIQLDRDTIRMWHKKFGTHLHNKRRGRFCDSDETRSVDILQILFGDTEAEKIEENIRGAADETYPTRKGEIKKHPELFDKNERFLGTSASTNVIEGGNWRIKYMLKTLYSNLDSIFGRTAALCIKESMYTFRNGKPDESYAHRKSNFTFAQAFMDG